MGGLMDAYSLKSLIESEIDGAVGYLETETTEQRRQALSAYLRDPYGNEVEGRSQIVTGEVAEVIDGALPQLMRVFATDDVVRFEPVSPGDEEAAKQATEYCNWVLNRDNEGFIILRNWFFDALLQKVGIVKTYWDTRVDINKETYRDLTDDELLMLLSDGTLEVVGQDTEEMIDPMGMVMRKHTVEVQKRNEMGTVKIENVPPEEFIISKRARNIQDSPFVAHRRLATRGELVAMGFDKELVASLPANDSLSFTPERVARFSEGEQPHDMQSQDFDMQEVEVFECYVVLGEKYQEEDTEEDEDYEDESEDESEDDSEDMDDEEEEVGLTHRYKIFYAGNEILSKEECDFIPFHSICPIPIPHKFYGQSLADRVTDLQLIKTTLTRQMLDNLYLTNNSRMIAVDGQVNLDDLLTTTPGGVVRVKNPNAVAALSVQSVASQTYPMMEYIDSVQSKRTGVSDQQQGLDPSILQNVTATAVAAMTTQAQGKLELVARTFAETGVKSLFKGILYLAAKYSDKPRILRLRNKYVSYDPRTWKSSYDVTINVGLGNGNRNEQLAMLQMVMAKQEEILKGFGPANPLVSVSQYRNTLAKMIEAAGIKDVDAYVKPVTPEDDMMLEQQAQQQQPDPNTQVAEMLAQVEREKNELNAATSAAKIQLDREQMQLEIARKSAEMTMKAQNDAAALRIKEAELALKQIKLELETAIASGDADMAQSDTILKAINTIGSLIQ
jgi:hypothetical protein